MCYYAQMSKHIITSGMNDSSINAVNTTCHLRVCKRRRWPWVLFASIMSKKNVIEFGKGQMITTKKQDENIAETEIYRILPLRYYEYLTAVGWGKTSQQSPWKFGISKMFSEVIRYLSRRVRSKSGATLTEIEHCFNQGKVRKASLHTQSLSLLLPK